MTDEIMAKKNLFCAQKILLIAIEMSIRTPGFIKLTAEMKPDMIAFGLVEKANESLLKEARESSAPKG